MQRTGRGLASWAGKATSPGAARWPNHDQAHIQAITPPVKLSKYFDQSGKLPPSERPQSGRRRKGHEFLLATSISATSVIKFSVVLRKFLENFRSETFPKVIDG
jgi:hypothetical protein